MPDTTAWPFACRNCRRPLHWADGIGWLHGELPQYAAEDITCERPIPVCEFSRCHHADGPGAACTCRCHHDARPPSDTVLAFCQGAQICPTDCDDDCETACHEAHYPASRRSHKPDQCPSRERSSQ